MHYSKLFSAQNHLLSAHLISVETDISRGLHSFSIVGLGDRSVDEAKDRVSAAIKNSGFKSPKQQNAKVVVSLAPADLRKEGPSFDLPIALGYLLAADEIDFDPEGKLFVGELSLDGGLRKTGGVLSYARLARREGFKEIFVPKENAAEAAHVEGLLVYGAESLSQMIAHLSHEAHIHPEPAPNHSSEFTRFNLCLDDVVGQEIGKRGLIIAAAGGHNIALYGPPGTGKTMLARALRSILPPLSREESLEVTEIHSIAGTLDGSIITEAPVRAPHHTASFSSLVGGGTGPKPGEATLSHRGILFMDEFPEFDKKSLEALRQPLEDRTISIARAKGAATFPADFILVAAMNPCPCGNFGSRQKSCSCSAKDRSRYEKKVSGPIMDRIDLWIEVSKVDHDRLLSRRDPDNVDEFMSETSAARDAVARARHLQKTRAALLAIPADKNASVSARDLARWAQLSEKAQHILDQGAKAHGLSGRGYHRVVKVARTIADLSNSETIEAPHILEALQYRQKSFGA
ncbi:MAG TPA: YifB family Mg chelatase-like AAA ATPase [Candidatus Paceibacterota bacterium]|jgi:Mg chelatase-related protein